MILLAETPAAAAVRPSWRRLLAVALIGCLLLACAAAAARAELPCKRPLPMVLGPIARPAIDYLPTRKEHRSRRSGSELDLSADILTVGGRSAWLDGARDGWSGRRSFNRGDGRLDGGSKESLFARVFGAVPLLNRVPLKSTGRGMGLELGRWDDLALAFELSGMVRNRSWLQTNSDSSSPLLSLSYVF